jgi:sarcosine oxidase gamma subunit
MGRQSKAALDASAAAHEERTCASCGRRMPDSAAPDARYCSDACRRHRVDDTDRALEAAIAAILDARAATSSTCPSEAARAVAPDGWRPLMEPARRAARRMVARGEAEITQGGSVVDPSTAKGPIRIRRPR